MKIFIDVDNTIIEHYGFYSYETESRIHKSIGKYPMDNLASIKYMYETSVCNDPETLRDLFKHGDVHILTKYPDMEYEYEKQKRVASILGISVDELISMKAPCGVAKYLMVPMKISKVDIVKEAFDVNNITDCVLVDDYSQNIIEWEMAGGIGIKYFNEYNSPSHPVNGISISNFKFFEAFMQDKPVDNLLLVGINRYKLKLIEQNFFSSKDNVEKIEVIKIVLDDMMRKLDVLKFEENHKYSYLQFVIDYYEFMDHINDRYWADELKGMVNLEKTTLFTSIFEPNLDNIFKHSGFSKEEILTMHILSNENPKPKNIYDVYLTINEKKMINNMDDIFLKITNILKSILFV